MRIDLAPIVTEAQALLDAIERKQRGQARDAAHRLMCALPIPSWADPAPGVTILYGPEKEVAQPVEWIRHSTATWIKWLVDNGDPGSEWPTPAMLTEATRALEEFIPQNASVS